MTPLNPSALFQVSPFQIPFFEARRHRGVSSMPRAYELNSLALHPGVQLALEASTSPISSSWRRAD